jgi:hypothetical protein
MVSTTIYSWNIDLLTWQNNQTIIKKAYTGVNRSRILTKDRQYSDQIKKDKMTNNDLQNTA